MGRDAVTYTLQLLDRNGDPVGPEPDVNRSCTITTYVIDTGDDTTRPIAVDVSSATLPSATRKTVVTSRPDSSGRIVVGPLACSDLLAEQNEVVVAVDVVAASGNALDVTVQGTALSFGQFMEVLAAANDPSVTDIRIASDGTTLLTWSDYDVTRPRDRASWTITGICG